MEHSLLQLRDYYVINNLAEGTYGEVYKVQHKITKQSYALKVLLVSYLIKGPPKSHISVNETSRRTNITVITSSYTTSRHHQSTRRLPRLIVYLLSTGTMCR
jgi:serine/threonine protein kinase